MDFRFLCVCVIACCFLSASGTPLLGQASSAWMGTDKAFVEFAEQRVKEHPKVFHYVCPNGYRQTVLRTRYKATPRPGGRFRDRKLAPARDKPIGSFGGRPSAEALAHVQHLFAKHNRELAAAPLHEAGTSAAGKVEKVKLPPLGPDTTAPGERFSAHAKQLLRTVTGTFELNGKPAYPDLTLEKTLEGADFVASLTQSKNKHLREAAVLTIWLYAVHFGGEHERFLEVAEQVSDSVDLAITFAGLLKSNSKDERDQAFKELGKKLGKIVFTRTFQQENQRRYRSYLAGYLSAAAREQMVQYARQTNVGHKPRTAPIRVTVEHVPDDRTYLRITNQTQQPQRHVLIVTRGSCDPDHVRYHVKGARVEGAVGKWFGIIPEGAQAEMPSLIQLWEWLHLVDVGNVLYLAELPVKADIRVAFCANERMKMTEDIRVSFWSDELHYEDIRPANLTSVLRKVRPADEVRMAKGLIEREQQATKKANDLRVGLAQFSLNLAKESFSRGDTVRGKAFLREAIRNAPDSPAGKEAQKLLDNPDLVKTLKSPRQPGSARTPPQDPKVSRARIAQQHRQALQWLTYGKRAMAAKNREQARYYLKQAISVAPDSPAGKTAARLMQNLDR